jgi:hypothetical protein
VVSAWQLPLPEREYATLRVVVYFYSDRWIPITCFSYTEALALYRKALLKGKEIFLFPTGLDLETKNILLAESSGKPDKLAPQLACGYTSRVESKPATYRKADTRKLYPLASRV